MSEQQRTLIVQSLPALLGLLLVLGLVLSIKCFSQAGYPVATWFGSRSAEMRRALACGEFDVYYQPIVTLDESRLVGVEALVRWRHPLRGLLMPETFIPLAEQTGLIVPLGSWVLAQACRQTRLWQLQHPESAPLSVSVNLSAHQLQQPTLPAEVARILDETGLAPHALKLEITESAMLQDTARVAGTLQQLKRLGVRLAIDDFGTGYCSLNYLRHFPIDILKIDRSFMEGLGKDAKDTAIVQTIIMLGQTLGINVVGEGLETDEQIQMLRSLGCDRGQGYFFARPLMASAIETLITEPAVWPVRA